MHGHIVCLCPRAVTARPAGASDPSDVESQDTMSCQVVSGNETYLLCKTPQYSWPVCCLSTCVVIQNWHYNLSPCFPLTLHSNSFILHMFEKVCANTWIKYAECISRGRVCSRTSDKHFTFGWAHLWHRLIVSHERHLLCLCLCGDPWFLCNHKLTHTVPSVASDIRLYPDNIHGTNTQQERVTPMGVDWCHWRELWHPKRPTPCALHVAFGIGKAFNRSIHF